MNDYKQNNRVIFSVTVGKLQHEAVNRIGRKLTDDELYVASKGIKSGLSFDVGTVFQTALEEAIEENQKRKFWNG